jgi:antirestriction protein ArdC
MFTQSQLDSQPSFPSTNPPSPVPPGPVPAPAPRQAGDIPDPPLNSAGSSGNKGKAVFEIVTDRIIALLEQGTVPWRADWVRAATQPISFSTGKPYRGINHFLLSMLAHVNGYASPYWLTFNQVRERGGKVRKGEKGSPCFFWKVYDRSDSDQPGEDGAEDSKSKRRFVARYFVVFNVEQCEQLDYPKPALPDPATCGANAIATAEQIVCGYHGPTIETKGLRPCYQPLTDTVQMPERRMFFTPEGYYATLFHELSHSTGHASRLERFTEAPAPFGSADYSREELIAELGAAFLCSEAGIAPPVIENQAAYLAGWLKALKADRRAIVVAAAQAERAADLILNRIPQED